MSLPRRCLLALGVVPILLAAGVSGPAQDAPSRPANLVPDLGPKESQQTSAAAPARAAPPAADPVTRTGARKSAVVSAVERVRAAVVNIHSERTISAGGDHFALT